MLKEGMGFDFVFVVLLTLSVAYILNRAKQGHKGWDIRRIPGLDAIEEGIGRATAVSYTHLDVYKRQIPDGAYTSYLFGWPHGLHQLPHRETCTAVSRPALLPPSLLNQNRGLNSLLFGHLPWN